MSRSSSFVPFKSACQSVVMINKARHGFQLRGIMCNCLARKLQLRLAKSVISTKVCEVNGKGLRNGGELELRKSKAVLKGTKALRRLLLMFLD